MDFSWSLSPEEPQMDIVGDLPPELAQMILKYLTPRELTRCSGVSRKWRSLTNCSPLWRRHCYKEDWKDLNMVDNFKSHFPPNLFKIANCETIEQKCKWRLNYERHQSLPVNWERNRSVRYRLCDARDGPVSCLDCDGELLGMAFESGLVTVLNVERLPEFVTDFTALLDSRILQIKIQGDLLILQQHMLLQIFSLKSGFVDAKSFDYSLAFVEFLQRTRWKLRTFRKLYKAGKLRDIFVEIINENVYVAVRDLQCIYVWDKYGKRIDTIHVPNRMCKLRDMIIYKNNIYIIYAASRHIRHVTGYDIESKKWIFEVTTPLCKTQKLFGADSLLAGVAVAGPGLTCTGVITVWDRKDGKIVSERHTPEYLSFRTTISAYELIVYAETTSVNLWEPRSDTILRKVSTVGNPVYLRSLPFTFLAIFTDRCAYVWDWFTGAKCFRIFSKYVPDTGEFMWADEKAILIKTEEDLVDMIGFC